MNGEDTVLSNQKVNTEVLKPLYLHDCDACKYLGRSIYQFASQDPLTADVYYCANQGKHIGEEECILVRWSKAPFSFGYFPYFIFYLSSLYVQKENEGVRTLLKPYLFGLQVATERGLIKQLE